MTSSGIPLGADGILGPGVLALDGPMSSFRGNPVLICVCCGQLVREAQTRRLPKLPKPFMKYGIIIITNQFRILIAPIQKTGPEENAYFDMNE